LHDDARAQGSERFIRGRPLHLHPVRPPVTEFRIEQAVLQVSVIGQQQKAFAVGVQASGCIDAGNGDEVLQGFSPRSIGVGELRQHAVRLVKE